LAAASSCNTKSQEKAVSPSAWHMSGNNYYS
jgi:hypothetical protein